MSEKQTHLQLVPQPKIEIGAHPDDIERNLSKPSPWLADAQPSAEGLPTSEPAHLSAEQHQAAQDLQELIAKQR